MNVILETIKEFITFDRVIMVATLIVACLAYRYNRRSEKRRIQSEIARKKAQLRALEDPFSMSGVDHTVADKIRVKIDMLRADIEELETQL